MGLTVVMYADLHKYLGLKLDEHVTFKDGVNVLAHICRESSGICTKQG